MSTRSRIGYIDPKDKSVKSVYCHFDGYPSHNGKILFNHYKKLEDVKALVEMGCMSVLGESLETCEFYHRDRGEGMKENKPREDVTLQGFLNKIANSCEDYFYLMDEEGKWKCITQSVTHKIINEDLEPLI